MWDVEDVDRHHKNLSPRQKRQWIRVANSALQRCKDGDGDDCEGMAVRMANGVVSQKAVWSTAFINDLPDSSFLYVESGGKKDSDGKTTPRSKRHFPYKDGSGKVDLPHLRNAIARIPQSNAPGLNKESLQMRARRLLSTSDKDGYSDKDSYEEKDWRKRISGAMGRHSSSAAIIAIPTSSAPKKKRSGEGTWARRKRHAQQRANIAAGLPARAPKGTPPPKPPAAPKPPARKNPPAPKRTGRKPPRNPGPAKPRPSYKASDITSSLMVFKDSSGQYRWVLYSSNPYLDRDKEYVTHKAHVSDIRELDSTGNYGPLRWWHMGDPFFESEGDWRTVQSGPGIDIGTCDFSAMHDRIRVESGTFKSARIGRAIANHAEELGGSLAFAHPVSEPDDGGGFINIKTFERSLTPHHEASNIFTTLLVSEKGNDMDGAKLKALKALGVDIDEVLDGAEQIQQKADKSAPYRMKSRTPVEDIADDDEDVEIDLATRLDALTAQMRAMEVAMKDEPSYEPEEKLEDLMVSELTVGELQDIISQSISTKSAEPMGVVMKAVLDELEDIKSILTSKSVQSVVDEVARMKAKLERTQARLKATASRVRELDDAQPSMIRRNGIRPSQADDTLLDLEDDADIAQKSGGNPFSWIDDFIQKQ